MAGQNFYVSDYHFFHQLPLIRSRKEFVSVEQMNQVMVEKHNFKVSEQDHIYILGDVIVCKEQELEACLIETIDQLKGHLHLILGNHDQSFKQNPIFLSRFETVEEALWLRDGEKGIQLFHYPILEWHRKHKGSYHIYGHLHNETQGKEIKWLIDEPHALNACVEINHYEPCTLEEMIRNNEAFKQQVVRALSL